MFGFHHDLDHEEGFFLGVISFRGVVRALMLSANQEVMSSAGWGLGFLRFLRKGVSTGQGVSSQFGDGLAVLRAGGVMVTWITV
jgi:hypothetical protein